MSKKIIAVLLTCILCLTPLMVSAESGGTITNVKLTCSVTSFGQVMDYFEVTVDDASILEGITAEDFSLEGLSGQWGTTELHEFSANISDISVEDSILTLYVSDFTEKYFYVDSYTVACPANDALTFTMEDVASVSTLVADDFEQVRMEEDGSSFDYNLYTPKDTSAPQPLVLALHGSGDSLNLLPNRVVVSWAEADNQRERACYVLAPLFQNTPLANDPDKVLEESVKYIQELIEDGKVDPNRVYVMGKSMGGRNTYRAVSQYPDVFAGALVLCGRMEPDINTENLSEIPFYIIHGEEDKTVPVQNAYDALQILEEIGNQNVLHRIYDEEEMNAFGIASHHDVEIIALENTDYMKWLFAQTKAESTGEYITNIVVNTSVPSEGHRLDSFDVTVNDASVLEGLTKEDFSLEGLSGQWGTDELHDFTVTISSVSVNGNVLTIHVTDFTEKYFYVDSYTVTCTNPDLTFTMADADKTTTAVADEFEQIRMADGASFDYNFFTPDDTSNAQPLVLALHGSGDSLNLLPNRVVVSWAEPENQKERPCYVLAPVFQTTTLDNDDVIAEAIAFIDELIEEGKVDPERVYVMGKSMGGFNTYRSLVWYPDMFAAGMPLCGRITDDAADYTDALANIPLYIIHGEKDAAVKVEYGREAYELVKGMGNRDVYYREYNENEMNDRGIGSHHDVEIIALENTTYMEWMFLQTKSGYKTQLRETIEEAKAVDAKLYTEESYKVLETALADAIEVDENYLATHEEVKTALTSLRTALDSLVKPGEGKENGKGGSTGSPKTGETLLITLALGVLISAGGIAVYSRRKKTGK